MEFNGNYVALYLSLGLIGVGIVLLIAEQVWYVDRSKIADEKKGR